MAREGEGVDVGRRIANFVLGGGLVGLIGSVFYPVLRFVIPPPSAEASVSSVVAASAEELAPNEGKIFRFGSRPGILIRMPDGNYRAFSAVCEHLQCTVQYRSDLSQIWCACHNGMFNLRGEVLSGPPPGPLEQFKVAVRDDDVIVSRG